MNNTTALFTSSTLSLLLSVHQEPVLIGQLNRFFRFDHNILLMDWSTDFNRFSNTKREHKHAPSDAYDDASYPPQSVFILKNDGETTDSRIWSNINTKNALLIAAFAGGSHFESNKYFLPPIATILQLQPNMKIGLFFPSDISANELIRFFQWFYDRSIINVFAAFYPESSRDCGQSLNIFTFNPFGQFDLLNVTETESFNNFFLGYSVDLRQHLLRLVILENFWSFKHIHEGAFYETVDEKMWKTILRVLNATMETVQANSSFDLNSIPNDVKFDIFLSSYENDQKEFVSMYPITMDSHVFVLPAALPYPQFMSYLKSLASKSLFVYCSLAIVAIITLLSVCRYVKLKNFFVLESVCDAVNLLMNDNGRIVYQKLSRSEGFLIIPLTFVGLVIVNGFLSNLQSYVTRPIIQSQINSLEDLYNSPFPIIYHSKPFADGMVQILQKLSPQANWSAKVGLIDFQEQYRMATTYNASVAFCYKEPKAKVLVQFQKTLNIRRFHISNRRTISLLDAFRLRKKYQLLERVEDLVRWIRSAGLYEKWIEEEDRVLLLDILRNRKNNLGIHDENGVEKFSLPYFLFYGWIASFVVFVLENIF